MPGILAYQTFFSEPPSSRCPIDLSAWPPGWLHSPFGSGAGNTTCTSAMDGSTLTLDSAVRIGMCSPTTGVLGPLLPLKIPQPESSGTAVTAAVKRLDLFPFQAPPSGRITGLFITTHLDLTNSQKPTTL